MILLLLRATTEAKAPPIRPSGTFPRRREKGKKELELKARQKREPKPEPKPKPKPEHWGSAGTAWNAAAEHGSALRSGVLADLCGSCPAGGDIRRGDAHRFIGDRGYRTLQ